MLTVALLMALATGSAGAASLETVGSGFEGPSYVTSDPSNPDRLFVVERRGTIQLIENGELKPFANLSSLVSLGSEGGLLSIALAPDFASSGRLFVYYTGKEQSPAEIHVAEMTASGSSAPQSSLRNLLTIEHTENSNHYGGQLQFGPEGNLFIATGDGGGKDDPGHNAQDLSSLLGKLLRINPNPSGSLPYTVPAGNPFGASPAPFDTIWSYGLRNPFRFSFDRLSGDLWIGDVGQDEWEEIDFAAAPSVGLGANYGWSCREGRASNPTGSDPACGTAGPFVNPLFDYPNPAQGCAIIGGYVARGPALGDLYGRYLYGDLCTNNIRSLALANPGFTDRSEGLKVENLNSFGEDSCGRLYAVSGNGPVYRIRGTEVASCGTSAAPPPPPLAASFVGIRALRRKVVKNRRTLITAWASPCKGRRGDPVTLWRGNRKLGTRRLDRVCTVRFRPRISRRSRFRATVKADATYAAAISRKLTVKPKKRVRKARR